MTNNIHASRDALGDLQARHWRLMIGLTKLCAKIELARGDTHSAVASTTEALNTLISKALAVAFCKQDDIYVSTVASGGKSPLRISTEVLRAFRVRHPPIQGYPTNKVLPVSAGDFACFHSHPRVQGDGLIACLGSDEEPAGLLFLWPKESMLQEDEDVFTVVTSCVSNAFSVAAQKDAKARADLAEKEIVAWRDMATKIAHLTTTPLVLAECEMRDALERRNGHSQASIEQANAHLQEARQALDRAFLFEHAGETIVRDNLDLRRTMGSAFAAIGEAFPDLGTQPLPIFGNAFRLRFAVRDLLVCAQRMRQKGGRVKYSLHNTGAQCEFHIKIPVRVSEEFKADWLFSPQHYVAGRENGNGKWPLSISLFLAKQLIEELQGGVVKPILSEDRSLLTLVLKCALRRRA